MSLDDRDYMSRRGLSLRQEKRGVRGMVSTLASRIRYALAIIKLKFKGSRKR